MDSRSAAFAAKLLETFKVEAQEHLKTLSDGLLVLESQPDPSSVDRDVCETIFREAHSLKGAARAVNHQTIQDICQSVEDVLSALKQGKIHVSSEMIDTLYQALDEIGRRIQNVSESPASSPIPTSIMNRLKALLTIKGGVGPEEKHLPSKPAQLVAENSSQISPEKEKRTSSREKTDSFLSEDLSSKTIRVDGHKLDILMEEIEEMLIFKQISFHAFLHVQSIHRDLKQWQKRWNAFTYDIKELRQCYEMKRPFTPTKPFTEFLENQVDEIRVYAKSMSLLEKNTKQEGRFLGSMITLLLEDAKKLLMQPFQALLESFPRMIRDLAKELGKKVAFSISGQDIEVDRRVLENIKDPLLHLVRNSIDHGIEIPHERIDVKKEEEAHICITAVQKSGNQVEISVSDDGRGIDTEKVKEKAVAMGLLTADEAQLLSDDAALQLILKSGISTSDCVTELSGRGIGMGVVAEKVEKLGGAIKIENVKGQGCTFRLILPLTIATFRGVQVRAAQSHFIFPTQQLVRVIRLLRSEIVTVEGKEALRLDGRSVSYIHLADLLHLNTPREHGSKYIYAVILQVGDAQAAIGVDTILTEQEVLIKSLGMQLQEVHNISGVTILEEGKVVPILDPFDLIRAIQHVKKEHTPVKTEAAINDASPRTILVVEDSATARALLKNILESAGFKVLTAVDGVEGLGILRTESVQLVVSDVEMPRMDGFILTQQVRTSEELKHLPVILCTSRGSAEDRAYGMEVGANAYLDKSNFVESNLLEIVNKLL